MRVRSLAVVALAAAALVVGGCQLLFKLKAEKIVILTWLQAPEINVAPFSDDPSLGIVTVQAFVGDGGVQARPITGGFAAFFGAGRQFIMNETDSENAPGMYALTSLENEGLPYDTDENRRYGFKACATNQGGCTGEDFTILRIRAAPAPDAASISFTPALEPATLENMAGAMNTGTELTVTFPEPGEVQYRPIVNVIGPAGNPGVAPAQVFTSLPTSGPELFAFVSGAPSLAITIPAESFAAPGIYLVLTATARMSLDTSENVFLGSGAIAGAMTAFVVEVRGEEFAVPQDLLDQLQNLPANIPALPGNLPSLPFR